MQFKPDNAARFQPMNDNTANIQVATQVQPGEAVGFTVSGSGVLPTESDQASQSGGMGGAQASDDTRPGGGLGPPTDAPDPLHQWRWYILGGFVAMLGFGAIYMVTRQTAAPPPARAAAPARPANGGSKAPATRAAASTPTAAAAPPALPERGRSGLLLEALKEEIFQLEIERQQGKISPEEYEKAKAALDQTLHRAVTRKSQ
jgi:hypothetical protein